MNGRVRIGCSGWQYRDWKGAVYPTDLPMTSWLAWYAEHLPMVELNSTFYRLPGSDTVRSWRQQVPPDFQFTVKLGSFGSHRKKLRDPELWLGNHVARFAELGDRLGPTLVQLPPRWRRNAARLEAFLASTPPGTRWAVEFRDPSWLHDEVFDVLQRHGAALCIHDLLPNHPRVSTTGWAYVRFHGPDALHTPYAGSYPTRALRRWAEWIDATRARGDVYAAFNNDIGAHAFHDADRLIAMVERRSGRALGAHTGGAVRANG